ncbi:TPA: flagellar basal body-associated FliL family protein [Photobacterium damselae]
MMKSLLLALSIVLTNGLISNWAYAADNDTTAAEPAFVYYTLNPDITTNYVTSGKQLGYLRVQVDLMLANPSQLELVKHHEPLIRDAIIQIIGQQQEIKVKSLAGREEIRKQCLHKVNDLLVAEAGNKLVTELLFTKYLYQ